jgi:hypothetical protein
LDNGSLKNLPHEPGRIYGMKSWKLALLGVVAGACVAGGYSVPALAQAGTTAAPTAPPPATHRFRQEDVFNTMTKVSRDVWRAKISGTSAQHMQELFLDGQRAYFKGDYDAAMSDFTAAEKIYKKYPNAITPD